MAPASALAELAAATFPPPGGGGGRYPTLTFLPWVQSEDTPTPPPWRRRGGARRPHLPRPQAPQRPRPPQAPTPCPAPIVWQSILLKSAPAPLFTWNNMDPPFVRNHFPPKRECHVIYGKKRDPLTNFYSSFNETGQRRSSPGGVLAALLGSGGLGRRSLARLAIRIADYELVQVEPTEPPGRRVHPCYMCPGAKGRYCCFEGR